MKKRRHSLVLAADNGEETGERAEAHLLLGLVEGAEGSSGEQSSGSRARGDGSSLAFISRRCRAAARYIHTMIAFGPQFLDMGTTFGRLLRSAAFLLLLPAGRCRAAPEPS